jgi:uncharacterized RmlC-like cupin family protein
MLRRAGFAIAMLFVLLVPLSTAFGQATEKSAVDKPVALKAGDIVYTDAAVPGFQPGMKMAVVSGDPSKAEPYTLRLKFPDGYAFPPHWHPVLEHVTVLSGTFYLGMGDTVDKSAVAAYHPGDFLIAPPRMSHFGWVKGETVVQLHGIGPFAIKLAGEQ